jgi:hypothetical protein
MKKKPESVTKRTIISFGLIKIRGGIFWLPGITKEMKTKRKGCNQVSIEGKNLIYLTNIRESTLNRIPEKFLIFQGITL